MQIAKDESARVLRIVGTLEIGVAEELHHALREVVGQDPMPIVDLSGIDACDTAALQLLYSASKTAESAGKTLELGGVSAAIRNTSAALGLSLAGVTEDEGTYQTVSATVVHIARRQDEYYPSTVTGRYVERLRRRAADVEFHLIDGGHQMPSDAKRLVVAANPAITSIGRVPGASRRNLGDRREIIVHRTPPAPGQFR